MTAQRTIVTRPLLTLVAAALLTGGLGSLYAFSIFLEPLQQSLAASRAEVSAVFSTAAVAFTVAMLGAPYTYNLAKPGVLVAAACILATAGLALAAEVHTLAAAWVGYGVLFGLANGLGYSVALQAVNNAWQRRRGLATGVMVAMYAGGAIVAAPLFRLGVDGLGVHGTLAAMAVIFAAAALPIGWLMTTSRVLIGRAPHAGNLTGAVPPTRVFWLFWLALAFGAGAGLMVISHAAGVVAEAGGAAGVATAGVMGVAAGNVTGRLGAGWLTDHLPIRQILVAVMTPAAAGLFILALAPHPIVAVAALSLMGLAYGSLAGCLPAAIALYYGHDRVGSVFGRVFTAWGLAGLTAPYLAGLLFDLNGTYSTAILFAAASALLAAAAGLALPRPRPLQSAT